MASSRSKAHTAGEGDKQMHGRLRLHGPRDVVVSEDDQRRSLAEKTQRTLHLHVAVLASGAADFEAAPGRVHPVVKDKASSLWKLEAVRKALCGAHGVTV